MSNELSIGKRTITSKKYSGGIVGIVDMSNDMWAVVAINSDNQVFYSRSFCYTEKTEKTVWEACRKFYKIVKECVYQKRYDELEDLDN